MAADVDQLYWFIVGVTAFFGILVCVLVVYFAVKYRTDDPLKVGAPITAPFPSTAANTPPETARLCRASRFASIVLARASRPARSRPRRC